MARIYVSSSFEDLRRCRRRVAEKIRELGHVAVGMEADGAQEARPLDVCLKQVRSCKGYIGLVALRYGTFAPGHRKSFTELEYEEAAPLGKRMLFVADARAEGLDPPYVDEEPEKAARAACLEAFRTRIETHYIARFSSIAGLAAEVEKAIRRQFPDDSFDAGFLPYLCDRQAQEEALEAAIETRLQERPVLVVVHGDLHEEQHKYVERLRIDTLPRLLDLPQTDTVKQYTLTWPETALQGADMGGWVTRELNRVVMGPQRRHPATMVDLFRNLAATRMPILVSMVVEGDCWNDDQARRLSAFVRFWHEAPNFSSVQPLVVCLALRYPLARDKARWMPAWLGRRRDPALVVSDIKAPALPAITLSLPPPLGYESVSRQQVQNWLARHVQPIASDLRLDEAALRKCIDRMFTDHEAKARTSFIPMELLAERLTSALQTCRRPAPTNGGLFE